MDFDTEMALKDREDVNHLLITGEENADVLIWSMSSSSYHDGSSPHSSKQSPNSYSQSLGASTDVRQQVSIAETTPLLKPECKILSGISSVSQISLRMERYRVILQSLSLPDIPSNDRRASTTITVLNMLGMSYGLSTLTFPYIVGRTGLVGFAAIILLGILSLYTSLLLVDCQYTVSKSNPQGAKKRIYRNLIDIGTAILPQRVGGPFMKCLIASSLLSDVYKFILMGNTKAQLTKHALPELNYQHWVLIWMVLLLPFLSITRVSVLGWISFASLIIFIISVILIYVTLFRLTSIWSLRNIPLTVDLEAFFVGFGMILNSYNLQWYVPAVEGSMTKPEEFPKMITISLLINTTMKTTFALIGGLTFGQLAKQSVVENFSSSNPILFKGVSVVLVLSLFFYFPMGLYVVFEMLDLYFRPYFPILQGGKMRNVFWYLLSRSLVLAIVILLAVSFSQFGFVVGVIGSVRGTLVTIIFPCAAHLKLKWKQLSIVAKLIEFLLVLVSIVLSIGGTYYSAKGMIVGMG